MSSSARDRFKPENILYGLKRDDDLEFSRAEVQGFDGWSQEVEGGGYYLLAKQAQLCGLQQLSIHDLSVEPRAAIAVRKRPTFER